MRISGAAATSTASMLPKHHYVNGNTTTTVSVSRSRSTAERKAKKLRHKQEVAERVALAALLSERARTLQCLRGRAQQAATAGDLSGPSLDYGVQTLHRPPPTLTSRRTARIGPAA
jgi:hypothetical protein